MILTRLNSRNRTELEAPSEFVFLPCLDTQTFTGPVALVCLATFDHVQAIVETIVGILVPSWWHWSKLGKFLPGFGTSSQHA